MNSASGIGNSLYALALSKAVDKSTLAAARLGLVGVGVLAITGSAFGLLFAVPDGTVTGFGIWLVTSCLVFSIGLLLLLTIWPLDRLAPVGITATAYFGAYLSASAVHAVLIPQDRGTLLVSLIWFTPLQALNKIVNGPRLGRIMAWMLFAAPLLILGFLSPRIFATFPAPLTGVLVVFALAHVTSALLLNILWRYREALISENERSASFRFAAEILEDISESFVLVDRANRLLYLNKMACGAGVQRNNAEGKLLGETLPLFASPDVARALEDAWNETGKQHFEVQAAGTGRWYEIHCTPGPKDMSVYFRDITERKRGEQMQQLEHSVARCLAEAEDPNAALRIIMRNICESEDWDLGRYFRLDEATGVMRFEGFWGKESSEVEQIISASQGISLRPGEGLVGGAWLSGEPLWCGDASSDARVKKIMDSRTLVQRAALVFPLGSAGKIIGVLSFTSSELRAPDERLLVAIRVIGVQIGQYLLRKQAESVLRDSETRFRRLTALSSDWYWEMDADLRFSMVSASVSPAWGISATEIIGRARWELPGTHPTERARSLIDDAVEARLPYRDLGYEVISPDGSRHYLQSSAEPMFDEAGQFTGYRGVGKDVTKQRQAERLKDEFVSTVSHELRTPLTSVAGALGLIVGNAAGELPEPAIRLLSIVYANCKRLVRLVNDILDIEKLEAGQVVYNYEWLGAMPLVEQAIETNRGFAEGCGVHVRLSAASNNYTVRADADRLLQALTNLLSNAVKFSAKDGEVIVQIESRGEIVRISVRDYGSGVPADFRSRIFQKFAQADATNTRERGGTGLGLNIVQQIVTRLGGEVGFSDAPGGGTIFHIDLPSWDRIAGGGAGLEGDCIARVLFFENDPETALNLRKRLLQIGYGSDFVSTADEALTSAEVMPYTAIVVDMDFAQSDGSSLILSLRERLQTSNTPIIALSATPKRWRDDLPGIDVQEWFTKPADIDRLLQVICTRLAPEHAVRQSLPAPN